MEIKNCKIPNSIIRKIIEKAPTYTVSENYGRRGGFYGDSDEYAKGYKSICIYVQNGLEEKTDLFKIIAKAIFEIQENNCRKYPLLVFGFGDTKYLQHEKKYFDFGYLNDVYNVNKVAKTISRISGNKTVRRAIIPELFPKTDKRSLYAGKIKIDRDDLLIIIGRNNEVFISENLKNKIKPNINKQIFLVEIKDENVNYIFKPKEINFSKPTKGNNMSIKRILSDSLKKDLLNPKELFITKLKQDNLSQKVFLTIRDNNLDFYHKGGRLFKFDNSGFQTHIKYASVITKKDDDYLTESALAKYKFASDFNTNYTRIKENCSNYSGDEALGVSQLYHKYSYLSNSDIVVLDIEVSFQSLSDDKKQDRIDILLYNKEIRTLRFVEAKHYSNSGIWSTSIPKVVEQIERYERQLAIKKSEILSAYSNYIEIINRIFNFTIPKPEDIDNKVTLLIFGFDNDQKMGRLTKLITKNSTHQYNGIKNYNIGNIKKIVIENLWNQFKVL